MSSLEFIRPRPIGPRFEDGEMPLESLGDLGALGEMVIDAAKWRFLQENPWRRRVPKGFAESVSLKLADAEKGSAVPVITLEIRLLDPLDVSARLEEFKDMKDGWFEGEGVAPSPDGLDWLASEFERRYAGGAPLPYLYPTLDGGVRAEWSFGANAMALEIDLRERSADWLWFDRNSDANQERRLNLNDNAEWAWLANEVRSKAEAV